LLAGDSAVRTIADRLTGAANVPRPPLLVLGGARTHLTAAELGGTSRVLTKREAVLLH